MARLFSIGPTWSLRGRRFQGLRGFTGKPFHPPLTDFPIVCYTVAALFDLISFFSDPSHDRAEDFFKAATFVMVVGYVGGLAAAITGFFDWWKGIPRERSGPIGRAKHTQVWRTINFHATVMVVVTVITLIDILVRVSGFSDATRTEGLWLLLSLLSAGGVLFGAAYGGTLVFEYGFNVENVAEVWNESEEDHVRAPRTPPPA